MLRQEYSGRTSSVSLQWHHNGCDSVSNHQPHDCFLNRLFRHRSKKTSKLCVTGLCAGNSLEAGEFPAQMASNEENVSIWWCHHDHDCQCYGSLHRQVISSLDIVHVTQNGPSQWTNDKIIMSLLRWNNVSMSFWHKQRVLMHRHQGWNVRHGLCHIYMRYLYIYELFIAFVCFVVCSLL